MAHKYKVGDRVILGHKTYQAWNNDMDQYIGKVAVLQEKNKYGWHVDICSWFFIEGNITLVGCACHIKNCLTHRLVKNSPG